MNDLKFAFRQLLKNPGFTTVAVLTLALGIGANTAIFSVADKLLLRSLPVAEPERLALLGGPRRDGSTDFDFAYPFFKDLQRDDRIFSHLSALSETSVGVEADGGTERQRALLVSGNFFETLGLNAAIGRTFSANEGREIEDAAVVVLSHGLWQRRFGGDPQIIGRSMLVNQRALTVIGVVPPGFEGTSRGRRADLYVPITLAGRLSKEPSGTDSPLNSRTLVWHQIIGRLKDGVSHAQAQAALPSLTRQIHALSLVNSPTELAVLSGERGFTGDLRNVRLPLNLLAAISGLVLLIACANLANLQLARATARARNHAIRLALGARRGRLIRELLTESVLLSLIGGTVGLVLASWLFKTLVSFRPANVSLELSSVLDARVLGFTLLVSVLTGALFGLAPAWLASHPRLLAALKGNGSGEAQGHRWNLRNGLVVAQVALSLVVLVSAGLCFRSLQNLRNTDVGFDRSHVALMTLDPKLNSVPSPRAREFYDRLLERARTLPGVEEVALGATTPLDGSRFGRSISRVEGYQPQPNERLSADITSVSPDYFRAFGVPFLAGRDFGPMDSANGLQPVIVNEAFRRRFWPEGSAVGQRLYLFNGPGQPEDVWEVVGVTGSMSARGLRDAPRPTMFRPLEPGDGALTLAARSTQDASATVGTLRSLAGSIDPSIAVASTRTMLQQTSDSLAVERMAGALLGGLGLLALLLSTLGLYGVLAYSVSRRVREIGIRMALGAQVSDVLRIVFRQGLGLAGFGLLLGLLAAVATTRLFGGFLHGVQPLDPMTFASVIVLLAVAAVVAAWLPARRAARVDPMVALRAE